MFFRLTSLSVIGNLENFIGDTYRTCGVCGAAMRIREELSAFLNLVLESIIEEIQK